MAVVGIGLATAAIVSAIAGSGGGGSINVEDTEEFQELQRQQEEAQNTIDELKALAEESSAKAAEAAEAQSAETAKLKENLSSIESQHEATKEQLTTISTEKDQIQENLNQVVEANNTLKDAQVTMQEDFDKQVEQMDADREDMQKEIDEQKESREKAERETKKQRENYKKSLNEQRDILIIQKDEKQKVSDRFQGEIDRLDEEIEKEREDISAFAMERLDPQKLVIVLLGETGSGKSTLCNRLLGDESKYGDKGNVKVSGSLESCTQSNSKFVIKIGDIEVTVVDTPGLGDSNGFKRDRRHSNKLCAFMKGSGGINAFVLVRNGANPRLNNKFKKMMADYVKMFGEYFAKRLIVVVTRIEGRIKEQYEMHGQEEELSDEMCDFFEVEEDSIPIIPIGFDEYKESILKLGAAIPSEKHEFKSIKSPLDELVSQRETVNVDKGKMDEELKSIDLDISKIDAELKQFES